MTMSRISLNITNITLYFDCVEPSKFILTEEYYEKIKNILIAIDQNRIRELVIAAELHITRYIDVEKDVRASICC